MVRKRLFFMSDTAGSRLSLHDKIFTSLKKPGWWYCRWKYSYMVSAITEPHKNQKTIKEKSRFIAFSPRIIVTNKINFNSSAFNFEISLIIKILSTLKKATAWNTLPWKKHFLKINNTGKIKKFKKSKD